MDTLALLIAPILFIAAVLYVAYPLLQEARGKTEPQITDAETALEAKEEIINSLKDVEMDFRMGKLSMEDYETLKSDLEQRAVEAFQRLEELEKKDGKSRKKKS